MGLALINLQMLICHKTQINNQRNNLCHKFFIQFYYYYLILNFVEIVIFLNIQHYIFYGLNCVIFF